MIAALQLALGIVMPMQVAVTAGAGPTRLHETAAAPSHVAIAVAALANVDTRFAPYDLRRGTACQNFGGVFLVRSFPARVEATVPSPPVRGERARVRGVCRRAAHPAPRADVSPEGRGVQRNRRDEWFGNDKLRHFLMSMAATQFSYGGLRTASTKDDLALPFAIGIAAVAGVGKEVHDVRNGGPFSLKDLVWDAAGIVVAGVVLGAVR